LIDESVFSQSALPMGFEAPTLLAMITAVYTLVINMQKIFEDDIEI